MQVNEGNPTVTYSNFVNVKLGIDNKGASTISAKNNFWDDSSGPTHSTNPDGAGVEVSDLVDFSPWKSSYIFPDIRLPVPEIAGIPDAVGLNLGESESISFSIRNTGGAASEVYLDVSVSDNLDIEAATPSDRWSRIEIGSKIWQKEDEGEATLASGDLLYEMYESAYGTGERAYSITIKRTDRKKGWLKYRLAMKSEGIPQDTPLKYRYVRYPSSGKTDQQGWPAVQIPVGLPLDANITSLNYENGFVYMYTTVEVLGRPYPDLTYTDFEVHENGVLQANAFEVIPPTEGGGARLADIVFLMDNSGSMKGEQDQVRDNVIDFVDALAESGVDFALGLCRYGSPKIEDDGALTSNVAYFKDDLWNRNTASMSGSEKGYLAIVESAKEFRFRPGAQKIFIIITDESPDQGGAQLEEVTSVCQSNSIMLFALANPKYFDKFLPITSETNGDVYDIVSDFSDILGSISRLISGTYVVK